MRAYSGNDAGRLDHEGPLDVVPQVGPSDGCATGRVVAVASRTRRHSSRVNTPSASGPRATRAARPEAATRARTPVRWSPSKRRASISSRTALAATYGVAEEVPPPMVAVLSVVLVADAPQLSHASWARCTGMLGQLSAWPLSSPPTIRDDGVACA